MYESRSKLILSPSARCPAEHEISLTGLTVTGNIIGSEYRAHYQPTPSAEELAVLALALILESRGCPDPTGHQ